MLIPTFAGSEITDSARGGGLYFILLNISKTFLWQAIHYLTYVKRRSFFVIGNYSMRFYLMYCNVISNLDRFESDLKYFKKY